MGSILSFPGFSFSDFECIIKDKGINTDCLSDAFKDELILLCEYFKGDSKQFFCGQLIGWAERNVSLIALCDRTEAGDAGIIVAIQKYAVQQLFLPDTGNGASLDRWQLLKDCFQLHEREPDQVLLKAMAFEVDEYEYTFGQEFRFFGNTTIIRWLGDIGLSSLCEYEDGKLGKELGYADVESVNHFLIKPEVVNGRLLWGDGEVIDRKLFIYVLSSDFEFRLVEQVEGRGRCNHSYMNGGLPVVCAGEVAIEKGKVVGINNLSGHYRPSEKSLHVCLEVLRGKGVVSEECCIMHLDEELKHLFFDEYFMQGIKNNDGLKGDPVPASVRGHDNKPREKLIFPRWQLDADSVIKRTLAGRKVS
ncbi:hypothetical protein DKY63_30205 [Pseudomonas putida]|uniref:Uncharacterized protein n=1 Tax=Pseudomonas putida TaxID=303 RepID=A0A2Z4RVZ9_PSEPU|nr:hypothetical protein DKY63_30205 [Pseudomonas putida]